MGDKVVCIDESRTPIRAPKGATLADFSFPAGYVQEGTIYCIDSVFGRPDGGTGLRLVGKPVVFRGSEVDWSSLRFRKVEPRSEAVGKNKQRELTHQR